MFYTLFYMQSTLVRPNQLMWLNLWGYGLLNSWRLSSTEVLSSFMLAASQKKTISLVLSSTFPTVLYTTSILLGTFGLGLLLS